MTIRLVLNLVFLSAAAGLFSCAGKITTEGDGGDEEDAAPDVVDGLDGVDGPDELDGSDVVDGPDEADGPVVCDPGETRCDPVDPTVVEICNDTQTGWVFYEACADGRVCQDGACVEMVCTPGEAECCNLTTLCICNSSGTGYDEEPCGEGWICLGDRCVPITCTPGERQCLDDLTVGVCNETGTAFDVLETCDTAMDEQCVDGECLSPCERAERAYSSAGCLFYGADLDQADQVDADNSDYAIVVVNTHDNLSAAVTVEDRLGSGGTWRSRATRTLSPGDLYTFRLTPDQHVEDTDQAEGLAYRVSSDVPVAAYQFNPIDVTNEYTNDASLLLPLHALGTRYRAAAGPAFATYSFHSFVTVVGTRDLTSLSVTVSADTLAGGSVPALGSGDTHTTTLDEGDVLQLAAAGSGGDLSGTYVEASAPVAVFGGSECSNIPTGCTFCVDAEGNAVSDCTWCDHLEEQMIPLQAWGRVYVAGRVPVRSLAGVEGSYWTVLASEDLTSVSVTYAPGTVLRTDAGSPPFSLDAGDVLRLELAGTSSAPGDALIAADKPILVVQYMEGGNCTDRDMDEGGDPSMILAVPTEQYVESLSFVTPSGYAEDHAVIVKHAGTSVTLDGTLLAGTSYPVASGWQVYRPAAGDGVHAASADGPFSVLCSGISPYNSYGYMGGLLLSPINPP